MLSVVVSRYFSNENFDLHFQVSTVIVMQTKVRKKFIFVYSIQSPNFVKVEKVRAGSLVRTETLCEICMQVTVGQTSKIWENMPKNVKKGNSKRRRPFVRMSGGASQQPSSKEAPLTLPSAAYFVGYWYEINSFGISYFFFKFS